MQLFSKCGMWIRNKKEKEEIREKNTGIAAIPNRQHAKFSFLGEIWGGAQAKFSHGGKGNFVRNSLVYI